MSSSLEQHVFRVDNIAKQPKTLLQKSVLRTKTEEKDHYDTGRPILIPTILIPLNVTIPGLLYRRRKG